MSDHRRSKLSDRLQALCDLVIKDSAAADIGTDHGFVPIALISCRAVPFVILTDIRSGPLEKARINLKREGIDPASYELRQGCGLMPLKRGEADSVIIAGMGAENIIDILSEDKGKALSFKRLILQPRKRSWMLRQWLFENGFRISREKLVREAEKICEIIVAEPGQGIEDDVYLPKLMREDALFGEFLSEYIRKLKIVIDNMSQSEAACDMLGQWQERLDKAERLVK